MNITLNELKNRKEHFQMHSYSTGIHLTSLSYLKTKPTTRQ
jgi:hypothetical protein